MDRLTTAALEKTTPAEPTPTEPAPDTVRTVLSREMLSIERRRYSRRDYRTAITVSLLDDETPAEPTRPALEFSAVSCNISQGGMLFRCPQHLTGLRLVIRFRLPERSYALMEAEIIHSRQEEDGDWVYGVTFRRLLPED